MRVLFGLFLVAHGLVHGVYVGHALRLFEVKPGMTWPEGSWLLSGIIGNSAVRWLVVVVFSMVSVALAVSGVGLLFHQPWWGLMAASAAVASMVTLATVWNGRLNNLDGQGAYAVLINIAVFLAAAVLHWPKVSR